MTIHPLGNRIYFKPEDEQTILANSNPRKKERGTVLAVGKDVQEVKVGDMIIFTPWAVDVYEEHGETYYFVSEDPVTLLAKVEMS